MDKNPFIFISYSHKDSKEVLPLIDGLEKRGFRVWYDSGIEVATEWPEYIGEKIMGCSLLIAFISKNAVESQHCRGEITYAIKKEKKILAVYLKEDLELSPGVDLQLTSLQGMYRNRFPNDEAFLEKLSKAEVLKPCKAEELAGARYESDEVEIGPAVSDDEIFRVGNKTFSDGVYEGELVNGLPHGKGKFIYNNGVVYEGDWSENYRTGKGKITFPNGDVYEGELVNGKSHGKGKYTYADGDVYEGDYVADKRHGKGKIIFASGNVYEGDFVEGKYHGKGKYTYANGERYEGDFEKNMLTGKGRYFYSNGDIYVGEFVKGVCHGKGSLFSANGELREGEWKKGCFKNGVIYNKNHSVIAKVRMGIILYV